jgi:hypothetical protein
VPPLVAAATRTSLPLLPSSKTMGVLFPMPTPALLPSNVLYAAPA